MSGPFKKPLSASEEAQKQEFIADVKEHAASTKSESDAFGEIDKRLGMLLARANELETTLNELNKHNNAEEDSDLDVTEEVEDEESFNSDIDILELEHLDLDTEADDNTDDDAKYFDNIDLNMQDD